MVTREQWDQAQLAERKQHTEGYEQGTLHYKNSYDNYFQYLQIGYDHSGKIIIEIGCADFPALEHCTFKRGIAVEPMPSEILKMIAANKGIELITEPVEDIDLPACDEIWLLNVMQHIIDPEIFVSKCKKAADVIRFFEPINYPTCIYHPHSYTFEDYDRWFGAKYYNDKRLGFHQAECAYGAWIKK